MLFNKTNKDVDEFAQKHGYKGAKYNGKWKEYKVYEPYMDENQVSYIGLPLAILVNDQGEIRISTSDEAMAIIGDDSYMESFEENIINEELNISNIQEAVDAYMKKFGGFPFMSLRGLPDNIIIEKVKAALKNDREISIDFEDQTDLSNGTLTNKNDFEEINQDKIMKTLENMNNSKMVNTQIETYFNSLMETQSNTENEYLSLPIINMNDKSDIKLQSSIISFYTQDDKKCYYCQGYINKNYDIKTLPSCELFEKVELINAEISMLSVISKGEYSNITIDELKEKYYSLLDTIKELVIKNPNNITSDESTIILDYLKLYRYLEKEEVQAYQSLKSDFLIWCLGCSSASNALSKSKIDEFNMSETSTCPVCNSKLIFIMPTGSPLYCKNCNKYFENNNGKAGKQIKKPTYNKDVFY